MNTSPSAIARRVAPLDVLVFAFSLPAAAIFYACIVGWGSFLINLSDSPYGLRGTWLAFSLVPFVVGLVGLKAAQRLAPVQTVLLMELVTVVVGSPVALLWVTTTL